jgi:hypothetical protein
MNSSSFGIRASASKSFKSIAMEKQDNVHFPNFHTNPDFHPFNDQGKLNSRPNPLQGGEDDMILPRTGVFGVDRFPYVFLLIKP